MSAANTKIVKFCIKNSPIGEQKDVLADIKTIVGSDQFLEAEETKQALRDYFETHMYHVQLPGRDKPVIVDALGRQEPIVRYAEVQQPAYQEQQYQNYDQEQQQQQNYEGYEGQENYQQYEGQEGYDYSQQQQQQYQQQEAQQPQITEYQEFVYYDPIQKVMFSFHPVTLEAKVEEEGYDRFDLHGASGEILTLRDEIVAELENYVGSQYRKGTALYSVFIAPEGHISVNISCHNLNFANYWGGEWLSNWTVDGHTGQVQGNIRVHDHYFEQGNIQFNLKKPVDGVQLKQTTGKQVVAAIRKSETNYQESLEEMYSEVSEKLLKGMRRIIPVTRTKFDWSRPVLM